MDEKRLTLLFGGKSGEHEVSLVSARNVAQAALSAGFHVDGVGITKAGEWVYTGDCDLFFRENVEEIKSSSGRPCAILPDPSKKGIWLLDENPPTVIPLGVVFPVLHGAFGEDGTVQGLLQLSEIPFVGPPLLPSAVCMDKDVAKRLLKSHGVPNVPGLCIYRHVWKKDRKKVLSDILESMELPIFVKPSGSGSSIGVSKVGDPKSLEDALEHAFMYDGKVLAEVAQEGLLEIECSVLGNIDPAASIAGQIVPMREFYDYSAKYEDPTTVLHIPAPLDEDLMEKVKCVAVKAFRATECMGMARVDFFVNPKTNEVLVNEINTIPGFTAISMYPKLWEESGISFPKLIKELVRLALERRVL